MMLNSVASILLKTAQTNGTGEYVAFFLFRNDILLNQNGICNIYSMFLYPSFALPEFCSLVCFHSFLLFPHLVP